MLRYPTTFLTLLAVSGCPSSWRARDTALEVPTVAVTLLDWHQTRGIVAGCEESNPIIGPCGGRMNANAYFIGSVFVELIVSRAVSSAWRPVFQAAWLGAETATVWDNAYGD